MRSVESQGSRLSLGNSVLTPDQEYAMEFSDIFTTSLLNELLTLDRLVRIK